MPKYKSKKRIAWGLLIAVVLATVVLSAAAPALAAGTDTGLSDELENSNDSQGGERNAGYYISYILSLPINGIIKAISSASGVMGFYSIEELVFPENTSTQTAYVFTENEWKNVVMPWYKMMLLIAAAAVTYQIVILWVGYNTIAGSINPQKIVSARETAWNMLLVIIFMTQVPNIARLIFEANAVLVDAIKNILQNNGLYDTAVNGMFTGQVAETGNPLLNSLVGAAFMGLMLSLNFLYMVRKFVLGVLITVSPLVAWSWLTKKKTPVLLMMSEIVSNGFMSFSHALVLAFYASMVAYNGDGMFSTWWAKLFAISLLIPVSSLLRKLITGWLNLIGLNEERYSGGALGGLAAAATVITGTFGASGGRTSGKNQPPPQRDDSASGVQTEFSAPSASSAASLGTVASSINAFSKKDSKDAAIQSADSWMKSADTIPSPMLASEQAKPEIEIPDSPVAGYISSAHTKQPNSTDLTTKAEPDLRAEAAGISGIEGQRLSTDEGKSSVHYTIPDKADFTADDNTAIKSPGLPDTDASKKSKLSWTTLENLAEGAAKVYNNHVAPAASAIFPAYGELAGIAIGLANGKSYQKEGGQLVKNAISGTGFALNTTKKAVKAVPPAANQIKSGIKKTISILDKPSFKGDV